MFPDVTHPMMHEVNAVTHVHLEIATNSSIAPCSLVQGGVLMVAVIEKRTRIPVFSVQAGCTENQNQDEGEAMKSLHVVQSNQFEYGKSVYAKFSASTNLILIGWHLTLASG